MSSFAAAVGRPDSLPFLPRKPLRKQEELVR